MKMPVWIPGISLGLRPVCLHRLYVCNFGSVRGSCKRKNWRNKCLPFTVKKDLLALAPFQEEKQSAHVNKSWVRSWESHAQSHNYHHILKEWNYIRKMIILYTGIFEMEGVCSHELFEFNLLIKSKAQYQEENLSNFCENTNIWYI